MVSKTSPQPRPTSGDTLWSKVAGPGKSRAYGGKKKRGEWRIELNLLEGARDQARHKQVILSIIFHCVCPISALMVFWGRRLPASFRVVGLVPPGFRFKPLRTVGPYHYTDDVMPCHGNSGIRPFAGGKCHPRPSFEPERLLADNLSIGGRLASFRRSTRSTSDLLRQQDRNNS